MASQTQFLWTGTLGAGDTDWNGASGTLTNWRDLADNSTTIVPGATGDQALFTDGVSDTVSGTARADQITIENNTFVTINSGHIGAGDILPENNAQFPDDLVVDDESKLVLTAGADMGDEGKVSVIGLSGDGSLEVDAGGGFSAQALIIGDSTDGTGVVTVNGAAGFFVVAPFGGGSGDGELDIGNQGNGSLDIESTAAFFTSTAVLGVNQGAVGDLSLGTSTWSGGDLTIGAAGAGHATIGLGAVVALLDVIVGSAESGSGDLTVTGASFSADFLTIGASGTGTATFETDSTGTFTAVTVGESAGAIADLTMDGATWNTGSLTIGLIGTGEATAGAGEVVTFNDAVLGSGDDASGDLTIDDATLNGGTLVIGHDGEGDLEIVSGSSGSVASVVVGEDADSSGTLTIDDANWSVGTLTVGLTGTGEATVGTGAVATLDDVLVGPNGGLAVTQAAGSVGTVISQVVSLDFGTLDVSQGGQVLIGAETGANGAVAIGANSSLTGLGSLEGDVVLSNGGLVQATAAVPGALTIDGNISGSGTIQPLMTLEANGAIDTGVTIAFGPSIGAQVGDLVLDVASGEKGTITGFGAGNTIDIRGADFTDAVFTQGGSGSAGTLTLSGGASTPLSLAVFGDYSADAFMVSPVLVTGQGLQLTSSASGPFVAKSFAGSTDAIVTLIPCFAAGTRIATPVGNANVEDLRVGQEVRCLRRGAAPIVWIGRRHIDLRRHPTPSRFWPVRVRRDAFSDGAPGRDLFLSPDHAVFANGVLIPIRYLTNGSTIEQVPVDAVTYYHIELAEHDVVWAEGLEVESYLDTTERRDMVIEHRPIESSPGHIARTWESLGCAKLVLIGHELNAVQEQLARRARAMGQTPEPEEIRYVA